MKAKNLQLILQIGTILSFLTLFLVSSSLLFPYITSKQLVFNSLVALMLPFYIILVWRYRQYRIKKKFVAISLIAYLSAILLSSFFSVDFSLSFWGNAERMLGWFHLSHYFLFFFYLLAAWRNKKEWYYLLSFFVAISVIISLIYLGGNNLIGNTAYLSGFLLFSLFLSLVLFVKSPDKWRYLWLVPLLPIFLALYQARTSGAFFALAFSLALMLFLLALIEKKRIYRFISFGALIFLIVAILGIFSQRDTDWFQEHRLLSGLTFDKPTFQTRLVSWEGAAKEIPNNWLLGVGYGNYAYIFDKQFDSRFLDYARTETFFDRAHNNIIDITATTGVIGLITYLAIFVGLLFYLFKLFKKRKEEGSDSGKKEIIILLALLSAYFVQNLAVFDTQSTYIALMLVLAYIVFLAHKELNNQKASQENYSYYPLSKAMKLSLGLITAFSLILLSINYQSANLFSQTIRAYSKIASQSAVETGLKEFKEAMEIPSPIKRDARSILINHFNESPEFIAQLPVEKRHDSIDYIVSLAKENVNYNPVDTKANLHLSQTKNTAASLTEDQELADNYLKQAMKAVDIAIESSPERAPLYLSKAQVYLSLNKHQEAVDSIKKAISLNENIPDGYCHISQIYFLTEKDEVYDYLDECIKKDGLDKISLDSLLVEALEYYKEEERYSKALEILKRLEEMRPSDSAVYFELIMVNLYLDNKEESIRAANRLVDLEETIDDPASIYIEISNNEILYERYQFAIRAAEIAAELEPSLEPALDEFIEALKEEGSI